MNVECTNIQQDSAVISLVDNMVLEDLVIQSSGFLVGGRHILVVYQQIREVQNGGHFSLDGEIG